MIKIIRKNNCLLSCLFISSLVLSVFLLAGCGSRPHIADMDDYFIRTEPVVERLVIIERELRIYAEGLSERKDMSAQEEKLAELRTELVDIISRTESFNPESERTSWMQIQLLNWQYALRLGLKEALAPKQQDPVKQAFDIYRYLDLSADYGRIARSERTEYAADMHGPN